jgi:hypothetical protein
LGVCVTIPSLSVNASVLAKHYLKQNVNNIDDKIISILLESRTKLNMENNYQTVGGVNSINCSTDWVKPACYFGRSNNCHSCIPLLGVIKTVINWCKTGLD